MKPLNGRIDIMLVPPTLLVPINTSRDSSVNFDGHYPLLGGEDTAGSPLYMSNLQNISLIRKNGEGVRRHTRPLVLKHNPSDGLPPYPNIPRGAMDQTGPLYWLQVWPTSDPELLEDLESRRGKHKDWYHNPHGDHHFDVIDIVQLEIREVEVTMEDLRARRREENYEANSDDSPCADKGEIFDYVGGLDEGSSSMCGCGICQRQHAEEPMDVT